jgi:hypothetical protein
MLRQSMTGLDMPFDIYRDDDEHNTFSRDEPTIQQSERVEVDSTVVDDDGALVHQLNDRSSLIIQR